MPRSRKRPRSEDGDGSYDGRSSPCPRPGRSPSAGSVPKSGPTPTRVVRRRTSRGNPYSGDGRRPSSSPDSSRGGDPSLGGSGGRVARRPRPRLQVRTQGGSVSGAGAGAGAGAGSTAPGGSRPTHSPRRRPHSAHGCGRGARRYRVQRSPSPGQPQQQQHQQHPQGSGGGGGGGGGGSGGGGDSGGIEGLAAAVPPTTPLPRAVLVRVRSRDAEVPPSPAALGGAGKPVSSLPPPPWASPLAGGAAGGAAAHQTAAGSPMTSTSPAERAGGTPRGAEVAPILGRASGPGRRRRRKKGRKKPTFQHGNYDKYYGYRLGGRAYGEARVWEADPRMQLFRKDWFVGRDCLDVGCNAGYVTIAMAEAFGCRRMLGVDIDATLIAKARKLSRQREAWRKVQAQLGGTSSSSTSRGGGGGGGVGAGSGASTGVMADTSGSTFVPASCLTSQTPRSGAAPSVGAAGGVAPPNTAADPPTTTKGQKGKGSGAGRKGGAPWPRVVFMQEDFADTTAHEGGPYDVVTCLSVTKWVHLNRGDAGLQHFFRKLYSVLRPGGILILEPQPWKSYKKRSLLTPAFKTTLQAIQLRPTAFAHYLIHAVGFESYEQLQLPASATTSASGAAPGAASGAASGGPAAGVAKGFRRPVYAFRKPGRGRGARGVGPASRGFSSPT